MPATIVALELILVVALVSAPAAAARETGRSDSGRVVRHVMVSDRGVRLQEFDRDSTSLEGAADGKDLDGTITIGGKRHRFKRGDLSITRSRTGEPVRIMGPVVMVGDGDAGLVRVFSDAEVPAGERVQGDVVAVFGSVEIAGQVSGDVVAVFGSVRLAPGATVEGDAVAVGGTLDQPAGATVGGQSLSLGLLPITWGLPALPILLFAVLIGWLSTLFLGWILHLLFHRRMLRVAATASRRTGLSLLLGLLSAPLMVVAMVLLVITVLGIPIAVLLPLFYCMMTWAGQIAASHVIGSKLTRRPLGSGGAMLPITVGTLFVASFFVAGALLGTGFGFSRPLALFFHLLGALLLMGLTTIGTGAFLLSGLGSRPADVEWLRDSAGAAGPMSSGERATTSGA